MIYDAVVQHGITSQDSFELFVRARRTKDAGRT
jgi:hypothetical protein